MTSIGIMSMQRIFNYGSSLQSYGLRRMFDQLQPGATLTFVDYVPGEPLVSAGVGDGGRLGRVTSKLHEYGQVDASVSDRLRFLNHKRRYAKKYFPMMGVPAAPNHDLHLDLQVIGSDEVFNCVQENTRVGYSRDLFGHGSPAQRLISYAASFGNTTLPKIEEAGIRSQLSEDLSRFDALSVRDRNSARIVHELTGETPTINVDPVLAYDFMSLESRVPAQRLVSDRYIVVYAYPGRLTADENREVRAYARSVGARVICIGGIQACGDQFVDCDPFELLAYFRDADAVITDTFHGTIFSIINETPFCVILRTSHGHGYGNEEKIGFLLETFGLEDRRMDDVRDIAALLAAPIDGSRVARVLATERARTVDYLRANLARVV